MEHFFEYLSAIYISSLIRHLFTSLAHFKIKFFCLIVEFQEFFTSFEDSTLSDMSFTNIFSQLVACVLDSLSPEIFNFNEVQLISDFFLDLCF